MGIMITNNERTKCEIWKKCMGYMRPTKDYNIGKKQEHLDRVDFKESVAFKSLVNSQKNIDADIAKHIEDNFFDLL